MAVLAVDVGGQRVPDVIVECGVAEPESEMAPAVVMAEHLDPIVVRCLGRVPRLRYCRLDGISLLLQDADLLFILLPEDIVLSPTSSRARRTAPAGS